jgi:hypothetical protein
LNRSREQHLGDIGHYPYDELESRRQISPQNFDHWVSLLSTIAQYKRFEHWLCNLSPNYEQMLTHSDSELDAARQMQDKHYL